MSRNQFVIDEKEIFTMYYKTKFHLSNNMINEIDKYFDVNTKG
ncbi:hypothetical protein [Clostridium senegalense]|nr:hypothetical protein [Clostridium senegalense]